MSELVRRWGNDGWAIDDPKDGTEISVGVYPVKSLGMTAMIQCPAGSEEDDGDVYGRILNHLCCELATLHEENERLWECVREADDLLELCRFAMREANKDGAEFDFKKDTADYQAARAALGEVKP